MQIKNEFVKKHLLTILAAVSVIAMFLPFAKFSASSGGSDSAVSVSGFTSIFGEYGSIISIVLFLGPVALVVMNYIGRLEKYKRTLSVAVPGICLLFELITYFMVSAAMKAGGDAASDVADALGVSVSSHIRPQIGFFILMLIYIVTAVAGLVTYYGYTLDKAGIEKLKKSGADFTESAGKKAETTAKKLSSLAAQKVNEINKPGDNK